MADQPLSLAIFDEFQRKIFARFDAVDARRFDAADRRFDLLDARIDALSDQVARQTDAVLHRLLSLDTLQIRIEALEKRIGET
jgi:hypothetical protein